MDETQIRLALDVLKNNGLVEVRLFMGKRAYSGYFKNPDNLIKELKKYQDEVIYFVF